VLWNGDGDKLYFTNVATQKAIDRTSDVVLTTTDCNGDPGEDGTDKVLLWTAPMAANSLSTGIIFKFHCDGIISSATNSDLITISADFIKYFALVFIVVTDILASMILGLVNRGEEKEGIRYLIPLLAISLGVFFLIRLGLGGFMQGLFGG